MTNRISPIFNLHTNGNQWAYKAKRSTNNAIYYTKRNFVKNKITGHIASDLSKAFGGGGSQKQTTAGTIQ